MLDHGQAMDSGDAKAVKKKEKVMIHIHIYMQKLWITSQLPTFQGKIDTAAGCPSRQTAALCPKIHRRKLQCLRHLEDLECETSSRILQLICYIYSLIIHFQHLGLPSIYNSNNYTDFSHHLTTISTCCRCDFFRS